MNGPDYDALEAVAAAATPGPWELGDRWHVAGVNGRFGKGRCAYCGNDDMTLIWEGRRDINAEQMQTHVHESPEPWREDGIYSAADRSDPVAVVIETDEYGGCTTEDRSYIATFDPSMVADLLARARERDAAIAERDRLRDGIQALVSRWSFSVDIGRPTVIDNLRTLLDQTANDGSAI